MRKTILLAALMLIGVTGKLCAQIDKFESIQKEDRIQNNLSATEKEFSAPAWVNIQDFVCLQSGKAI